MGSKAVIVLGLACGAAAVLPAMQTRIDPVAVSQAISIGQSRVERDLARYHAPYRVVVNRAPVDHLEIITPFRQIVLAAQARAQIGDRSFGQRQGLELAAAVADLLEVRVELTFHPLHTYVGVPDYTVTLGDRRGRRSPPVLLQREPRFGPRVEGVPLPQPGPGAVSIPGGDDPMLGGVVVARFDARPLDADGAYDVIIEEKEKELARARIDLGGMR
jgi:hypothetical protein